MRQQQDIPQQLTPAAVDAVATPSHRRLFTVVRGTFGQAFSSLTLYNFRLLYQGLIVSQIGFWMQQVAMGWLVLDLSNSPFYLGLAGFFRAIPMLVVSPFGGVLADRLDRKRLLMATQALTMTTVVTILALILLGRLTVWHLLIASLIQGISISINNPTRQALLSDLVPKHLLGNAIALNSMSINTSRIIGPTLAGIIMGWVGAAGCFAFQSVGYIWSISNVAAMTIPARETVARKRSVLQNLVEGFRYCYQTKLIRTMLLMAAVPTVVAMPYFQLLPAYARDVLHVGPDGLGLLFTAIGAGALAGNFGLAATPRLRHRGTILIGSGALFGLMLCLLAIAENMPTAFFALVLAGGSNGVYMALNSTIIQETVPDELRGRVMSVYMLTWGLMPLGALPAGTIAEFHGAPVSIFIGGAIAGLFSLWLLAFQPRIRQI